jgi:hypothetical protein
MELDAKQKKVALIAGGALVLFLLYRYVSQSRQAAQSPTAGVPATDASSSDYASLAGQEQSDAAALQGQNSQLSSEIDTINQWIASQKPPDTTPAPDYSGQLSALHDELNALVAAGQVSHNGDPGLATQQPAAPPPPAPSTASTVKTITMLPATIATHVGGPFYDWYKNVYGRPPPAMVSPNAARYVAWTKGLGKAQAAKIPLGTVYQGHF